MPEHKPFSVSVVTPERAVFDGEAELLIVPGEYVKVSDTIAGFRAIIDGECDELPEQAFMLSGTIDQVFEKAEVERKRTPAAATA